MKRREGNVILNTVLIVFILVVVAAILFPVFVRESEPPRKTTCQSNLKEIATAFHMYIGDYDATLPSSGLRGGKSWNPQEFSRFASMLAFGSSEITWPTLLYPYMKNKDVIWCPSDPNEDRSPTATTSYWYKAAIDRAWFGDSDIKGEWRCDKEANFEFPGDQIVFYEHEGWHWGDAGKGLSNAVTINCAFLDGHVATKRIADSSQQPGPADPTAPGEPAWFNYDYEKGNNLGAGRFFDARKQGDHLP